jgi:hypothetical protein
MMHVDGAESVGIDVVGCVQKIICMVGSRDSMVMVLLRWVMSLVQYCLWRV